MAKASTGDGEEPGAKGCGYKGTDRTETRGQNGGLDEEAWKG